jgi:leucyl-tRNA synthetase
MSEEQTPVSRARELRHNMTKAEERLWKELRNRKFLGLKFNRQQPLIYQVVDNQPRYFIADFFCHQKQLVIEVDGKIHDFQKDEDKWREDILKSIDLNVIRIKNEETEDMEGLKVKIRGFIEKIELKQ